MLLYSKCVGVEHMLLRFVNLTKAKIVKFVNFVYIIMFEQQIHGMLLCSKWVGVEHILLKFVNL